MYGLLITVTGWTWEYIDEYMTLPRYNELREYWAGCPPVHVMVHAYLCGDEKEKTTGTAEDLLAMFPGGTIQ